MAQIPLQKLLDKEQKTLYELAVATGIKHYRLTRYRDGKAKLINLTHVDKLCEALNCQPADLILLSNGNGHAKKRK